MSINLSDPYRYSLIGSKEENEIRVIFYKHWEEMKNQMKVTIDRIKTWHSRTIQNINDHADMQIRILEADYKQQRAMFDKTREDNLEIAKTYHQKKQVQLFNELCIACGSLQFQVAHLEDIRTEIFFPQVIKIAEPTRSSKQDNRNIHIPEYNNRNSWPLASTASNVNNLASSTAIGNDSNDKCPICFMIFPLTMKRDERHRHVDEHMIDGQGTYNIPI